MTYSVPRRSFLKGCISATTALSALQFSAVGMNGKSTEPFTPLERKGAPKKVIVVGAGLAGLAAAYELSQAGHDVSVLEVRLRAGGRVRTLRDPFSDGLYAEAGARLFSDSYKRLLSYAQRFDLPYAPMPATAFPTIYHLRGKRLVQKPGEPVEWPYRLSPEELQLGPVGLAMKYMLPTLKEIGDPSAPAFKLEPFMKYDKLSFNDFLRAQGASEEAVQFLQDTSWFGPGAETTSALHYLVAYMATFFLGQGFYAFLNGNDVLPSAFASKLQDRIHYGAQVEQVKHGSRGVEAVFKRAGSYHSMKADHAIIAVPFSHLRHMEVNPALPPEDASLVDDLEFAPVVRIYLQVSKRFWATDNVSGSANTDLPIQEVAEQPLHPPATSTPRRILETIVQGSEALRLSELDEAERMAFAIEHMEKVHPGLRDHVEGGTSKFWGHGAYSQFKPGQMANWLPRVARSDGPLHLAGEHTSMFAGTMEGALESGQRAAREVNEAG